MVIDLISDFESDQSALFPDSACVKINCGNAAEALRTIRKLQGGQNCILIRNTLQFLVETRQFIGNCFDKLRIGGFLIAIVPRQFLYERKLQVPSRRNRLHRRFYTPNTLMADIEEAIDPYEFRVRFLGEDDEGYDYQASIESEPVGSQYIVVGLERIAGPHWRKTLEADEVWARSANKPTRFVPLDNQTPQLYCTVAPDAHALDRIILLKLDHRGDFLMALEAFRILRISFPTSEITLVCGSWNRNEAAKTDFFNKIVSFDFFPEDDSARLVSTPREKLVAEFAAQMAGEAFDLAIDLRLYEDSRDVLRVIDARHRAGFDRYHSFPWMSIRLNIPSATENYRAERGFFKADAFFGSLGRHRTFEIRNDDSLRYEDRKILIWGPYQTLNPGRFSLEIMLEPIRGDFEIPFDIMADNSKRTILEGVMQVRSDRNPQLRRTGI